MWEVSLQILDYTYFENYKNFILYNPGCTEYKNSLNSYDLFGSNVYLLNNFMKY